MSILIEQYANESEAAAAFFSRADLQRVALVSSAVKRLTDWVALKQPLHTNVRFEPASAQLAEDLASFTTGFEFTAADSSNPPINAITINCEFEANYILKDDYKPSPDEVEAFKAGNAILNTW